MLKEIIDQSKRCQRCGRNSMMTDNGELFCTVCGYVKSERMEASGPEWRSFGDDETNRGRTGDGTSLARHDMGLATVINPTNKDATGKPLSSSMASTIKRLRIWDGRSQVNEPIDRNYRQAFSELYRMKDKLTVSDAVVEKAAYIYRKALEKKLVRGRSISALMAAALYAACRDAETPRTIKDITQATAIKSKDISRCYRLILKELDLKMPVFDSVHCISRIASKIGLSEKVKRHAVEILKKAEEKEISAGKHPMGLAATALYLANLKTGGNYTQKNFADAANITEVTIRNRSKTLRDITES